MFKYILAAAVMLFVVRDAAHALEPSPRQTLDRVLESDPWGLAGARIKAKLTLTDKRGTISKLEFSSLSRQYEPTLSKSVIRFQAPADLRGAGFLQVQNRSSDDDRFLFLPDLKRARRVSGKLRTTSFMGTDFSYADLDRRDLRDGTATAIAGADVGGAKCIGLDVKPSTKDSEYSHLEIWARTDNFLPMRIKMYDKSGALLKTFQAEALTKVDGKWFIAKSRMTNHVQEHTTELVLEQIAVVKDLPDDEFTVAALERL